MEAAFGPGSPIRTQTTERLTRIFSQAENTPPVAARFREWRRSRENAQREDPTVAASSESLFIQETYLALLARLIARRFVAPRRPVSGAEELLEIVNVDYFSRRGIGNYGEGDFFSWLPLEPRWQLGLEDLVLETIEDLAEALTPYDFTQALPGILDGLYHRTVHNAPVAPVPRWLAGYVVVEELGLADDPGLSLLDPACGTGPFMSAAIETLIRTMTERGSDPFDLLFEIPGRVRGMDRDPLAVALARLNYLLALGGLVQEEHPPFLLPVYLADATRVPASLPAGPDDFMISVSTPAGEFPLPSPVIEDPVMLDWLLGRLTNYMDGAQLRLHAQAEEVAVQEVMNAYYNYLTAAKPRTPVPDALTPAQADILLETARSLVTLHIRGEGSLWLHVVQNNAVPAVFSRRGSDRLAGSGDGEFFASCSSSYLSPQGRAAMIMSSDEAENQSAGRRLVHLEDALPDAALLVTGPDEQVRLEPAAGPVPPDISWAEAKSVVRISGDV